MARKVQACKESHLTASRLKIERKRKHFITITPPGHHPSHRQPPHLVLRPELPHILRPQFMHLLIQMLPQHLPKSIHHRLQLPKPQFSLPSPTLRDIRLELLQPVVDLFVLREQFQLFGEGRHLFRENWEYVSLFDRVVDGEVVREVVAGLEEGAEGHALGFFAGGAGAVEEVPGLAEVVVLLRKSVLVQ